MKFEVTILENSELNKPIKLVVNQDGTCVKMENKTIKSQATAESTHESLPLLNWVTIAACVLSSKS